MKHTLLILLGALGFHHAYSQAPSAPTIVGAAGQAYQAHGVSLDWTLGEVATAAFENAKAGQVLLEGFHRSYAVALLSPKVGPSLAGADAFPNPFSTTLTLTLPVSAAATQVQVLDIQGRQLRRFNVAPGLTTTKLDLTELPVAKYILYLTNTVTRERWTQQVVKNR